MTSEELYEKFGELQRKSIASNLEEDELEARKAFLLWQIQVSKEEIEHHNNLVKDYNETLLTLTTTERE
jgi:hypothetical protein